MLDKADLIYTGAPLMLILCAISWHGAHGVSQILVGVMVIMVPVMFYVVYSERFDEYWIRREQSLPAQLYLEDTMVVVIAKLRMYASAKRDMQPMLKSLRERVRRVEYDLVELVNLGLIKTLLNSYSENPDFTMNLNASLDVINELLLVPRAKKAFQSSDDAKHCASTAATILRTCVDNRKSVENVGLNDKDHEKIMYKSILMLGMMCEECVLLQFAVSDDDCIALILDTMDLFPESKSIVKWGSWALINITMNHPPNRCDFVNAGGIPRVLNLLKDHEKDAGIQMQACGLFLNIFVEDPNAKYSIPRARESALTNGMGVILQDNLQNFSKDTKLCAVCRKLQTALMQVWT